jgi:hypothetical protein
MSKLPHGPAVSAIRPEHIAAWGADRQFFKYVCQAIAGGNFDP